MRNLFYWFLPITWMGIIFFSSAQPYEKQDIKPMLADKLDFSFLEPYFSWVTFTYHHSKVSIAELGVNGFIEFFIRKGAHFGAFFILMVLFYLAIRNSVKVNIQKILVVSFLLTLAYAIMDELHQGFTPNRTPYFGDVLIDGIGALTAGFILLRWQQKRM